jgi:hypothetical protein
MSSAASMRPPSSAAADGAPSAKPQLHLVAGSPAPPPASVGLPGGDCDRAPHDARRDEHVLVAGADATARARMLAELRSLLPPGTRFMEASETWELVARAAGSSMVVLTGDLGGAPAATLLRLLSRRNPALPVLAVGQRVRAESAPRPVEGGRDWTLDAAHA